MNKIEKIIKEEIKKELFNIRKKLKESGTSYMSELLKKKNILERALELLPDGSDTSVIDRALDEIEENIDEHRRETYNPADYYPEDPADYYDRDEFYESAKKKQLKRISNNTKTSRPERK